MDEGFSRERNSWKEGWNWMWSASRMVGALGWERMGWWKRELASVAFDVDGFSMRMCFPARRALSAHS